MLSAVSLKLKSLTVVSELEGPSQMDTKTVPDPTVLSPSQTMTTFLAKPSQNVGTQEEETKENQKEEQEMTTDHVDKIEEEDMEIDNSESEDESTHLQPAKVAKVDEMTKIPQPVGSVNGPLVGINTPGSEGGNDTQNDGNVSETTGQFVNEKTMAGNIPMDLNMGMNELRFHPPHCPMGVSDGHLPHHPMGVPDGHLPNAICPPMLHNQQITPRMPPIISPNMLLPPPFMPPMLDPQMPRQTGLPPGGMTQSLMGPHPGILPPQRFNPPLYPNNWQFRGQGRGRGRGLHQTQPVPSRFY